MTTRHDYPDLPLEPPQDVPERPLWPDRGRDWGDVFITAPIYVLIVAVVFAVLMGCGDVESARMVADHQPPQVTR